MGDNVIFQFISEYSSKRLKISVHVRKLPQKYCGFLQVTACTGRFCWERVLAMAILSVRHDPVRIQGPVK